MPLTIPDVLTMLQSPVVPESETIISAGQHRSYGLFTSSGATWTPRPPTKQARQLADGGEAPPLGALEADLMGAWARPDGIETLFTITASTDQGFDVSLHVVGNLVHADFGGLSETFSDPLEAMTWVQRAIVGGYELTTISQGTKTVLHRLAPHDGDGPELMTGSVSLWPFGAKSQTVRRN